MGTIKIFIVKYATTIGIYETEVQKTNIDGLYERNNNGHNEYFHAKDYAFTKQEAIEKANLIIDRKLKSIEKQKIKLNSIKQNLNK